MTPIALGKSGQLGQRFSSSLSSVGVCSHFVHASEWGHGDLGKSVHSCTSTIVNRYIYMYILTAADHYTAKCMATRMSFDRTCTQMRIIESL